MMKYDVPAPDKLKRKQQWFASIIVQPIDEESRISSKTPSGRLIEDEAQEYIVPSPTLQPAERIQIYNQQFWWRILNSLHESFPLVTRLFGYKDFNEKIGIPYIQKNLPNHWSLSFLGDRLLDWAEKEYNEGDRKLVLDSVRVDWAYNYSFMAAHYPPLGAGESNIAELETLMKRKVFLQPHLSLFELDYDLFRFRKDFLEFDPDYWLVNDFPKLNKGRPYYFVFYRSHENHLISEEITKAEHRLLQKFETGNTIEHAVNWLVKQEKQLKEEASDFLHLWLQKWILNQWLGTPIEI
jgi:hypothetical protein